MCVGAQTPRSLLVPKRASVYAAERERRGRAYESLAMSPPSSKRKPVLQRRASTCCSARCGGANQHELRYLFSSAQPAGGFSPRRPPRALLSLPRARFAHAGCG